MLLAGAPDAVALVDADRGERVTYAALAARVDAEAARLRADAGPDGLGFLFAGNDVASVVGLLGALAAGVPVALVDPRLEAAAAAALRARYRPEVVRGREVGDAPRGGAAPHPELALLLSTSGSTGSPKLVRLTRAAVIANARAIAEALALGPGEVAPTSLPLHYSYGLSVVTSHLAAGATVLLTSAGLLDEGFWRACRDHGATSLAGVPYSYQMLRRLDLAALAPPSLRTLTQAGGRLDPALVRLFDERARARGGRLYVMYGQTEATARIAVLPPDQLAARPGSVGRAIPGGALAIAEHREAEGGGDPAGFAGGAGGNAPRGSTAGEVVFRGPSVMMGYAEDREQLARGDEHGGVLATGDLGRLDADGYLWITGRTRRIGKVFGLRVSLDELEDLARGVPELGEVGAVAALAGDDRVVIVVEGADPAALAACHRALAARTGIHPTGFVMSSRPALPRLPSGKLDYRALEAG